MSAKANVTTVTKNITTIMIDASLHNIYYKISPMLT